MSKKLSERQRWVTVVVLGKAYFTTDAIPDARHAHERVQAVLEAFAKIGRIVRAEVCGDAIAFKARRS